MDDAAGQGTQKVKRKNMRFGYMASGVKFAAAGLGIVAAVSTCAAQEGGMGQPADLVKNGSFEVRGQENAWKLPEGWSISRGFGRNGGGGLVFEVSEPLKERKWPEQIVDVEPGRIYDLSAWVDANLDSPRNIAVVAQFLDKKGKVIASSRTIAHGPKKKWGKISARTSSFFESMGTRITSIFCIHWTIYCFLYLLLVCVMGDNYLPLWTVPPVAAAVFVSSDILSRFYKKHIKKTSIKITKK